MDTVSTFFQDLFKSRGVENSSKVLVGIEGKISYEENKFLVSPFRAEDIQTALKEMGPTKAPGADDFLALFFQRYWHIAGNEVTNYCLGVLNDKRPMEDFNKTNIVLISKISKPTKMINFRPISLCTFVYKVIAKAIVHRLQNVIDKCINKVQSAFVPRRLISDNVLLAYKILHTFRQKRAGKKGIMAVKLDMSKTYHKVEWGFIEEVMTKMRFAREWVELIRRCVSTVSYAVNVNGRRRSLFFPIRGLRQGDPLSPFLFLICSEGLSSLMRAARREGFTRGAKASRSGPEISHLLFADDCILFGEASSRGAEILKNILQVYESCSGQCVNFTKSTVFYSPNTTEVNKEAVSKFLGVRTATNPERYLGLPNMVGKKKKESFQNLVDRILMRIEGWSNSIWAAKGVLEKGLIWKVGTVAELINSQSREWNREVISHTFAADEADRILRIPLAKSFDPRAYTIQNVYKEFYRKLWNIELPTKVKIIAWKVSWNYLPTRANLFYKKLIADASCLRCGLAAETVDHLFRECPLSIEVWSHIPGVNCPQFISLSFVQLLTKTVDILPPDLCRIFCGALWAIWGDRNARIHKKTNKTDRHQSASGIVARNSEGKVLVSSTSFHEMVDSAFAAEAIACREAVQIEINIQKEEIFVEGDSLSI
ncbi:reverse transcriptase [Gossypium australe]|uniref:Reverse transcriptase n=1 Tax=Gossypium australe TaxID=47621 RepID=A0A5B6VQP4_9ROSI|nr:reverse transcriptase [Gossypium australe]